MRGKALAKSAQAFQPETGHHQKHGFLVHTGDI